MASFGTYVSNANPRLQSPARASFCDGAMRVVLGLLALANALQSTSTRRRSRTRRISAVADGFAAIEAAHCSAAGFLALGDAAAPLLHACGIGAVSNCISQYIAGHEERSPPLNLPRAAERWKRRRRADQVDVPAAAVFGVVVAAAVYAYDLPVNQGYVFLGASLWDAARNEFERLREIDRCTAELRLIVAEVREAATTADAAEFAQRYNSAEATLVELQTRVADGPLPRGR